MKHTGRDYDTIERTLDRDHFMTSEEAKDFGIVDHVITTAAGRQAGDQGRLIRTASVCRVFAGARCLRSPEGRLKVGLSDLPRQCFRAPSTAWVEVAQVEGGARMFAPAI